MQLTMRQWFRKNAKYPVYLATACIVAGQLLYAAHSIQVSRTTQEASFRRMSEIFSLGVEQHNRTLIESALGVGLAELKAASVALCESGKPAPVISIPTDLGGCQETEAPFGYRIENIPLIGMPQYTVRFSVPWIENQMFFFFTLALSAVFLASAYIVLSRMQRKLKKDILDPLTNNIAELDIRALDGVASSNVVEIRNLYSEYLNKLAMLKAASEENERNAQNAAIAQTAQMVAHDIRRPFSLMQMFLSSLRNGSAQDIKALADAHVADLENAMSAANNMMNDILDFGAEKTLRFEYISSGVLVNAALKSVSEMIRSKNIEVRTVLDTSECIYGDKAKLLRVLENIVSNAVQAMPCDGVVEIKVTEEVDSMRMFVRNTGSFISEARRSRVFAPFVTEGKKSGFGLGLAIVKKNIEAHGGKVACNSSREPMWTEFSFSIPKFQQASCPDPLEHKATVPLSALDGSDRMKILIVDDDSACRNLIGMQLEKVSESKSGLCVQFAGSFTEAIAAFRGDQFDLVLCDVELGKCEPNGFELARWMRDFSPKTYICMHSNIEPIAGTKDANEAGANIFVSKGMSSAELESLITTARTFRDRVRNEGNLNPEISVIDDEAMVLKIWKLETTDATVNTFRSPEEFFERISTDKAFLERQQIVVTDLCFKDASAIDGLEFRPRVSGAVS